MINDKFFHYDHDQCSCYIRLDKIEAISEISPGDEEGIIMQVLLSSGEWFNIHSYSDSERLLEQLSEL